MPQCCSFSMSLTGRPVSTVPDCQYRDFIPAKIFDTEGRAWCAFHAPIRRDSSYGSNLQSEIDIAFGWLTKFVKSVPGTFVNLSHSIFRRALNIGEINRQIGSNLRGLDFSNSTFLEEFEWNGAACKGRLIFENSRFEKAANFGGLGAAEFSFFGAIFRGPASFSATRLNGSFENANFKSDLKFRDISNPEELRFRGAKFSRAVSFDLRSVAGDVDFREVSCSSDLSITQESCQTFLATSSRIDGKLSIYSEMRGALALDRLHCNRLKVKAVVRGDINCRNMIVNERANLSNSTIRGIANFHQSEFHGMVDFRRSVFYGAAHFAGAFFRRDVSFKGCSFHSDLDISWATIYGNFEASSQGAAPESSGDISAKSFQGLNLTGVVFRRAAKFKNRKFERFLHCVDARFGVAPDFHGCEFHQDTTFLRTIFDDTSSTFSADCYRTLKVAMENMKSRHEEGRFFALEQKSLRNLKVESLAIRFVSMLYEYVSDFGMSVSRPAKWFFGLYVGFSMLYGEYFADDMWIIWKAKDISSEILRFSATQVLKPFDAMVASSSSSSLKTNVVIGALAAVQTALQITCFTLFLFAIRRRFKLD